MRTMAIEEKELKLDAFLVGKFICELELDLTGHFTGVTFRIKYLLKYRKYFKNSFNLKIVFAILQSAMAAENLIRIGLKPWVFNDTYENKAFWFEKQDGNEYRLWVRHQLPMFAVICSLYYVFISVGPLWMKKRKAFNLKGPLFVWNALLAIFSIIGTARILPEYLRILSLPNGVYHSCCIMEGHYPTSFWGFLFALSKIIEFGDTVFLVLRKKPVLFLHWYHHISMCWFTFYMYAEGDVMTRHVQLFNYAVHSMMYSYFAIKALGVHIPKYVSVMITSIQILQFITYISINAFTVYMSGAGRDCHRSINSVLIIFAFGFSYTLLFSNMFYNSYLAKPKVKNN